MSGGGRISGALTQCPLFYGRPIHALVATCAMHRYVSGQPVFRVGESATHLVVLVTGRVETHSIRANGDENPVGRYRAPDAVMEVGIFATDRTRRIGASAVSDVEAVLVPHDALLRAAADDAVLTERLLTAVADAAGGPVLLPTETDVGPRVLATLERLADTFGVRQPDGSVLITLRLTHTELAAIVAASRPDVGKALKALEASGALERADEYYLLTGNLG